MPEINAGFLWTAPIQALGAVPAKVRSQPMIHSLFCILSIFDTVTQVMSKRLLYYIIYYIYLTYLFIVTNLIQRCKDFVHSRI